MRFAIFLLLVVCSASFANQLSAQETPERLVFIGSQMRFEALENECKTNIEPPETNDGFAMEPICISMSAGFEAEYSIIEILEGSYNGESIVFESYDHYGIPAFSQFQKSMLYLEKHEGAWFHEKYTWNKVYQTTDGRYADCSLDYIDISMEYWWILEDVYFITPPLFDIRHFNDNLKNKYQRSPIYSVNDGLATCVKGIYATELLTEERRHRE